MLNYFKIYNLNIIFINKYILNNITFLKFSSKIYNVPCFVIYNKKFYINE